MICPLMTRLALVLGSLVLPAALLAADVNVAVAANFAAPMRIIAQDFERSTGHRLTLSPGATGQFYAQIRNGAPFAVLLAADNETPVRLEQEGLGVAGSRFVYATGRLVLWSREPGVVDRDGAVLKAGGTSKIAIADPKLAPYGRAALQTLDHLGLRTILLPRLVEGTNITQAFQFVATGNAALGFVALSQVQDNGQMRQGSGWIVPASMHEPIRQEALLLNAGRTNPGAQALLQYLRSEPARAVMRRFGYEA